LAEALLNRAGRGRFRAYSAGSFPKGQVHPAALELLSQVGFPTDGLRSKSWDEFAAPDAPELDFIFTVCDDAAGETCPIWPGHPMTAHWGIEDPAKVEGAGQREAFHRALHYLSNRISLFLALPLESIDKMTLQSELREIGQRKGVGPTVA
jgi:protein-tyrosine-phosphatase